MQQDKHFYVIISLLVVVIALLIWNIKIETRSAAELLNNAKDEIADCQSDLAAWKAAHPKGTAVTDADRDALSAILDACSNAVGKQ